MKITIMVFLLSLSVVSCKKEEQIPNNNDIVIETKSSTTLTEGGVQLSGNIQNVELPLNYGFKISSQQGETHNEFAKFISLEGTFNGDYSIDIQSDLVENVTYYYNAVAYTSNQFIYGVEKSFISLGSAYPEIEKVEPTIAHILDTISIKGKYFSSHPDVYFDDIKANTIFETDSLVKCIVPFYYLPHDPYTSITVKKSTDEESTYDNFSLYAPELHSIVPYEVYELDTFTIHGDHFDRILNRNIVRKTASPFDQNLKIIECSRTKLVISGIKSFKELYPELKIISQNHTIAFNNKIKAKMPLITDAPEIISFGNTAVIYGEEFPRIGGSLGGVFKLYIGDTSFKEEHIYRDKIYIKIDSDKLYKDFNFENVTINYLGEEVVYETNIYLDEPWIMVNFGNTSDPKHTHFYNGNTYAYFIENYNGDRTIGVFDEDNSMFVNVLGGEIPVSVRYGTRTFKEDKMYTCDSSNQFKSFNIITNEIIELSSFPGLSRSNALMEVVGDYIYFGLGKSNYTHRSDIWKYSISNNTWEFVLDFPGINSYDNAKINPLTMILNDHIYIGAGQPYNYNNDFWELNTHTDIISSKSPLPNTVSGYEDGAVIGNKGYYYNTCLNEYDPDTNTWNVINQINGMNYIYDDGDLFYHNGFLYNSVHVASPHYKILYKINPIYIK